LTLVDDTIGVAVVAVTVCHLTESTPRINAVFLRLVAILFNDKNTKTVALLEEVADTLTRLGAWVLTAATGVSTVPEVGIDAGGKGFLLSSLAVKPFTADPC
jgi:hypothetical protein